MYVQYIQYIYSIFAKVLHTQWYKGIREIASDALLLRHNGIVIVYIHFANVSLLCHIVISIV